MLKVLRRLIVLTAFFLLLYQAYNLYQGVQNTLSYRSLVQEVLAENDNQATEELILAMIYTETKGQGNDLMQASESSTGQINAITDSRESIRQGISVLSDNLIKAEAAQVDQWTAVQAYNFGPAYIDYIAQRGGINQIELAKIYSREVVAPSLGNSSGQTYRYLNPVALYYGGGELYVNGGNIYYAKQVKFNLMLIRALNLF